MKNNYSIRKFLDLEKSLFHPDMCYPGEWMLGNISYTIKADTIKMNSIEKEYNKFINENYIEPLTKFYKIDTSLLSFPKIYFDINKLTGKRDVYFSSFQLFFRIINSLLLLDDEEYHEYLKENICFGCTTESVEQLRDIIRNEAIKYRDIMTNGKESLYYEKAVERLKEYNQENSLNKVSDLNYFLEKYREKILDIRMSLKNIEQFFSKPIDTTKLVNCFNYDKLCLLAAYSSYESCFFSEKQFDKPHYSFNYMTNYIEAVKLIRKENRAYNVRVKVYTPDENPKLITVDVNDLIKIYEDTISRYPEIIKIDLDDEYINVLLKMHGYDNLDLSTLEGAAILSDIVQKMKDDKELAANWEFIPNSESDKKHKGYKERKRKNKIDYDHRENYVEKCMDFLDNSSYIYKIYGKGYFDGYIGYIYGNNNVILEKFYENNKTGRVSHGNATYIMKLNTFLQNSKYNKRELISKILSGEITDVSRVFHRLNNYEIWKQNISQYINGYEYTENVVNYIDSLLNDNVIDKKTDKTKVLTNK